MKFKKPISKYKNLEIFTNEIIDSSVFIDLCNHEEILIKFNSKITTKSNYPFANFPSKYRTLSNIKEWDVIIIRILKKTKIFEFITIIRKWGKFTIPRIAVNILNLKNHEDLEFQIIKQSLHRNILKHNTIDLAKINSGEKILYRNKNFITFFNTSKIPITLPRFIEITPELMELFFLIHGDGHYKYQLYFVNKNPDLHKFVIKEFKDILKIPEEIWRARLLFNNDSNANTAKEEWKKLLKIKEEQFYPSISKTELKTSETGNLRIVIDKTIVSSVFRYIFEKIKNLRGKLAFHALNGLLYAEGGVRKNKIGLHKITLSFNQGEKGLFERILKNTGILKITRVEQNSRFCISNWENLYKFFRLFYLMNIIPFKINNERCKKAIEGFLCHGHTKTAYKYLIIINKKPNFTIKELVCKMNHRPDSILDAIRKKQYSKFIDVKGKGINKNPYIISINKKGKEFLDIIKNLEAIYDDRFR